MAGAQVNRYHPALLVDGDGNFNASIEQDLNLADENPPIAAVSIMGVQSTGKSTLLNKCFCTKFQEMDESGGMTQTTKGIWMAKCPISNGGPKILVIDTEGSDGSERGREGDDSFEKKSAVFALATSNTVIFNMKCDNVGLYHGASRPLLKTVFQVMLGKFSTPRQVNLVFVLRDKNRSPLDALRTQLTRGLHEIWQGMSRSVANSNAALEDYFNIEVMTMSHYVLQKEEFDKEVEYVRNRLFSLVQHAQPRRASAFLALAKTNWKDIMDNKILDLNLNKITVDRVLCHGIMEEKSRNFLQEKSWLQAESHVNSGTIVRGFGKLVNSIMGKYLSQYDEETLYADESPSNDYRNQLTLNLSKVVEQSYFVLVANMSNATSEKFQEEIAKEIEGGGIYFAAMNTEKFIIEFSALLEDAHVQLAIWNHTSKQLEKMRSQLESYEEGARHIIELLKTLKKNKERMKSGAITLTAQAMGYSAAVSSAILAPNPATLGIAAVALGAAIPLPIASIATIITSYIKYRETKKRMKIDRQENGPVGDIMRKVESKP